MKDMNIDYVLTPRGVLSVALDGKAYSVNQQEYRFKRVYTLVDKACTSELDGREESELRDLLNPSAKVEQAMAPAKKILDITVVHGVVMRGGEPVHSAVARRIQEFVKEGLPYTPLLNFMQRCEQNPNPDSVQELYDFLDRTGLPITPDGHFLAYKGVREDFKDCHSGTFDNSPGQVHEIPYDQVDPDRRRECSYGFHVGAYQYAVTFARGHVMRVKVDPADAVAVPLDHDAQKLRCRKYEVLDEYDTSKGEMPLPLYGEKGETFTKAVEETTATTPVEHDEVTAKVLAVIEEVTGERVPHAGMNDRLDVYSENSQQDSQICDQLSEVFQLDGFKVNHFDTINTIVEKVKAALENTDEHDEDDLDPENHYNIEGVPESDEDVTESDLDLEFGIDRSTFPEGAKAAKVAAWYADQLGRDQLCRYAARRGVVKNAEAARRLGKTETAKLLAAADLKA